MDKNGQQSQPASALALNIVEEEDSERKESASQANLAKSTPATTASALALNNLEDEDTKMASSASRAHFAKSTASTTASDLVQNNAEEEDDKIENSNAREVLAETTPSLEDPGMDLNVAESRTSEIRSSADTDMELSSDLSETDQLMKSSILDITRAEEFRLASSAVETQKFSKISLIDESLEHIGDVLVTPVASAELETHSKYSLDMSMRKTFMEKFEDLPNIDELSSTMSLIPEVSLCSSGGYKELIDGEVRSDDILTESEATYYDEEWVDEEIFDVEEEEEETLTEDILDEKDILLFETIEEELAELDTKQFIEVETQKAAIVAETAWFQSVLKSTSREIEVRRSLDKHLRKETEDFLESIIKNVVQTCEDPSNILRRGLNKRALMEELQETLDNLNDVQAQKLFLNRKTVDYYRRRGMFRAIKEDTPELAALNKQKYPETLEELDSIMEKERSMNEHTSNTIRILVGELTKWDEKVRDKGEEFEALVRKLLLGEESVEVGSEAGGELLETKLPGKFASTIEKLMEKMDTSRIELAQTHLQLIKEQHSFSAYEERMEQIQNMGQGYKLRDYEATATEVMTLGDKCDDKSYEMLRVRRRLQNHVELRCHMSEKTQMLRDKVILQKTAYENLIQQRESLRKRLNKAKRLRAKLRLEIDDLSFEGGLLDKPALMVDYDNTLKRISEVRSINNGLRKQYEDNMARIAKLEERCQDNKIAPK